MADHLQLKGSVTVDAGAQQRLVQAGTSLLPVGIVGVDGDFSRGDVIAIRRMDGIEMGRGLANYSSVEARMIRGKPSHEFSLLLGYAAEPEMIHRDNLILSPTASAN